MQKYLILLFPLIVGCHTTKSIQKSHTDVEQLSQVHAALSNTAVTTSTIVEQSTEPLTIPEASITAQDDINRIIEGDSLDEETPEMSVVSKVVNGKLRITAVSKLRIIQVPILKTTVTAKTETTQAVKDDAVKTHSVASTVNKHTERSTYGWMWWLLLIPVGVYVFRKKLFG